MKKTSLEHHHHSIGIVILVVVAVMMVLVALSYFNPNLLFSNRNTFVEQSNPLQGKVYRSDFLNISFNIPDGFEVKDAKFSLNIVKKGALISLARNGTNFSNAHDYIEEFESRRGLSNSSKTEAFNDPDSVLAVYGTGGEQGRIYFFYKDNNMYILSTDNTELYDELDQVAQSFRYTGD